MGFHPHHLRNEILLSSVVMQWATAATSHREPANIWLHHFYSVNSSSSFYNEPWINMNNTNDGHQFVYSYNHHVVYSSFSLKIVTITCQDDIYRISMINRVQFNEMQVVSISSVNQYVHVTVLRNYSNVNILTVKLYNCSFKFRKVVRQQSWGEVVVLIPPSSAVDLTIQQWKNY